jgi:hypothetical protein
MSIFFRSLAKMRDFLHRSGLVKKVLREAALAAHAAGKFIRKGIGEA